MGGTEKYPHAAVRCQRHMAAADAPGARSVLARPICLALPVWGTLLAWSGATGAEPVPLTQDGQLKFAPVVLRDGQEIVYSVQTGPALKSLMRLRVAERSVEPLHPAAKTSEFEAAFSPDGRYCAFVQSQGNLNLKLIIRDTLEKRDAVYDPGGGFAGMHNPVFLPAESRILFSMAEGGTQHIFSVNYEGKDRRLVVRGGFNLWPAVSPDGRRLAFGSARDGNFEIYTARLDGSDLKRLTHDGAFDGRPAWSPDGKRIAFVSLRDGNYELYLMDADGTHVRRLTHHPERDDYPCWHPDGKHLVFVGERAGRFDLYLLALEPP
ncbi:MAG: hypothetical protein C4297_05060 [Gemmataceae bacterium]